LVGGSNPSGRTNIIKGLPYPGEIPLVGFV